MREFEAFEEGLKDEVSRAVEESIAVAVTQTIRDSSRSMGT